MITWGVVGVGLAGRARARAIVADQRCRLVGVARGRYADEFDVPNFGFEQLVSRVEAIAVCSPNTLHAEHVSVALDHGCHVLVEFPLTLDAQEASDLFEHAKTKQLVLHIEHIELLLAWHQTLKARLQGNIDIQVTMTKRGVGTERPEQFFGACVARLHNIADLSPIIAVSSVNAQPGSLVIELELESGRARLELSAGTDFKRATTVDVHDRDHHWSVRQRQLFCDEKPVPLAQSQKSLFALDHEQMMQRVLYQAPSYVSPARVINILHHTQRIVSAGMEDVGVNP